MLATVARARRITPSPGVIPNEFAMQAWLDAADDTDASSRVRGASSTLNHFRRSPGLARMMTALAISSGTLTATGQLPAAT